MKGEDIINSTQLDEYEEEYQVTSQTLFMKQTRDLFAAQYNLVREFMESQQPKKPPSEVWLLFLRHAGEFNLIGGFSSFELAKTCPRVYQDLDERGWAEISSECHACYSKKIRRARYEIVRSLIDEHAYKFQRQS